MQIKNINVKKTCSFYASEYHLATLLLPYIVQKIEGKTKVKTFLEETLQENIDTLISNIDLEKDVKKEVENIGWGSKKVLKYSQIKKELDKNKVKDINLIICGEHKYIEKINCSIEKWIKRNNKKELNIIINNCYSINELNNWQEIIVSHDTVLNTSGEVLVSTVL